jgi:hypothetical protein
MSTDCETFVHAGCLVRIKYDEDAESPREWDNLGHMICWHSRYLLGDCQREQRNPESHDGTSCDDPQGFLDWWRENGKGGVILPLYLYDHSGITMSCAPFSCPWDSGQVGYIYATREMMLREWDSKRVTAKMRKQTEECLRQEVSTYDEYLTGQVYGYEVYELLADDDELTDDEREGTFLDSCWGFFGLDYCRQQAREIAEHDAEVNNYAI